MNKKLNELTGHKALLVWIIIIAALLVVGLGMFLIMSKEPTISVSQSLVKMKLNEQAQSPLAVDPKGSKLPELTYAPVNASIASVSADGTITAKRQGTTKVVCKTQRGQKVSFDVKVAKVKQDKKVIYLTYEDGPGRKVTPALLKVLKKYDAKATFFPYAEGAEAYDSILRKAVKEGHDIGVLTYSNDYEKIYQGSDTYMKDFRQSEKVVEDILGHKPTYWRFPGSGANPNMTAEDKAEIISQLHRMGYACADWNAYTNDSTMIAPTEEEKTSTGIKTLDNVISSGRPPIIKMHDTKDDMDTVRTTEQIINHYAAQGYKFEALSSYYGDEVIAGN